MSTVRRPEESDRPDAVGATSSASVPGPVVTRRIARQALVVARAVPVLR